MWVPSEEVSRLRELLASPNDSSTQLPGSSQTLVASNSKVGHGYQAATKGIVFSDTSLVKILNGDKNWRTPAVSVIQALDALSMMTFGSVLSHVHEAI